MYVVVLLLAFSTLVQAVVTLNSVLRAIACREAETAVQAILRWIAIGVAVCIVGIALYGVLNIVQPGSFTQGGAPLQEPVPWSTLLYFSLTTLTTLGYGDIVGVKPAARMFATLEAAAGVLYVAITVARLVASRQEQKE